MKKLCFIERRTKKRSKSMMRGALEWPEVIIVTTDSLSHQNCKRLPEKWGYQMAQATTMGNSSCHSILIPCSLLIWRWGGHLPWNHFPWKKPPKPTVLAASVYNSRVWAGGKGGVYEKGPPIPWRDENFPHSNVLKKLLVKAHLVETTGHAPG